MAGVSDRREKAKDSRWGVYGEDIEWPLGFTCLGRKTGTAAHGETWILRDDIPEAIEALEKRIAKIEAGVKYVDNEIEELEQQLADDLQGLGSTDDLDALSLKARLEATRADSFDPYAADEAYGDAGESEEEEGDEEEGEEEKRKKALNVHDYEDPEALLEEKNRIRSGLEQALENSKEELAKLRSSAFQMSWKETPIPAQLARLDAPWLQFAEKQLARNEAAKPTDAKETDRRSPSGPSTAASKTKGKKGKKKLEATPEEKEAPPVKNVEYCAKLLSAGVSEASDGRRFHQSDALTDKSAIRSLIVDGEELLKQQWRLIIGSGGSFDTAGILPLVAALDVSRKHKDYRELYNAAFVSPMCTNGSVVDAVSKIAGKKQQYWFEDDLIKRNLKASISSMATLQKSDIYHCNIKPSNVFISNDGYYLLVGDFLPKTEAKRWFADLAKSLSNAPIYFSPELYDVLVTQKVKSFEAVQKKVNLHKHDVFCLGLTYYYITTRIDPKGFHRSAKTIAKAIETLKAEKHDPELVELLVKMLTFDPKSRPTFWDMLTFGEQAALTGQGLLSIVKGIFGITDNVAAQTEEATSSSRTATVSGRAKEESAGGCAMQ